MEKSQNIKNIVNRIINGKNRKPSFNIGKNLITGKMSKNPKVLIKSLMNSNDTNTANLGYLLNDLEYKYGIKLNKSLTSYILSNLELDIFANPLYRRKKLDYYQIVCYGCIFNYYNKIGMSWYFMEIFEELIGGIQNDDKEFQSMIDFLRLYIDNDPNNALEMVIQDYEKVYGKGNKKEILNNLRKMIVLINLYNVRFIKSHTGSYCVKENKIIALDSDTGDELVTIHEVGHMIDNYCHYQEQNCEEIREKACVYAMNNPYFEGMVKNLCRIVNLEGKKTKFEYDNQIRLKYGNINNYLKLYQNYIIEKINSGRLMDIFSLYNLSEEQINKIMYEYNTYGVNVYELAVLLHNIDYSKCLNKDMGNVLESCILDIISAVFKANIFKFSDETICLPISHNAEYYRRNKNNWIKEIMADYNVLRVMGKRELIDILRVMFGNDFVDYIEKNNDKEYIIRNNIPRKR